VAGAAAKVMHRSASTAPNSLALRGECTWDAHIAVVVTGSRWHVVTGSAVQKLKTVVQA